MIRLIVIGLFLVLLLVLLVATGGHLFGGKLKSGVAGGIAVPGASGNAVPPVAPVQPSPVSVPTAVALSSDGFIHREGWLPYREEILERVEKSKKGFEILTDRGFYRFNKISPVGVPMFWDGYCLKVESPSGLRLIFIR